LPPLCGDDARQGRSPPSCGPAALLHPWPECPHVAIIDAGDAEQPFRLIAAPSRSFLNTSFNNTPSSVAEGRPTALVHPEVPAGLGLGGGDRLRIGNRRGSVVVHARGFDGLQLSRRVSGSTC
jgi:anaerobic selenocysteine-containing dehydrogenase